jgi:hypothetical protein
MSEDALSDLKMQLVEPVEDFFEIALKIPKERLPGWGEGKYKNG